MNNQCPNITYHSFRLWPAINWFVLGTGPTADDDWQRAASLYSPHELARSEFALLNAALPPQHFTQLFTGCHHVTRHPEVYHMLQEPAGGLAYSCHAPAQPVSLGPGPYTTDIWELPKDFVVGGSAFFAAFIGLQLRIRRVHLLGCPMDEGYYAELLEQVRRSRWLWWFRRVVRSASGATRDLFGDINT